MTYESLMQGIPYSGKVPAGEAALVTQDSRKITAGAVFVCVQGRTSDGHAFAQKALDAGAGMIVTQHSLGLPKEVTVPDTRAAYALLCANYFGRPADKLTLVAVTGTNGKTTVSSVLKQLLQAQGVMCGQMGTIRSEIGSTEIPARFTTPEAWELHALLSRMLGAGCTHVVMEASSQALDQARLYGLQFELGVFTNLTQDHLDYHGTMEEYFTAKKLLFNQCNMLLTNIDDEWGCKLLNHAGCPVRKSFSVGQGNADFSAADVELHAGMVRFELQAKDGRAGVEFPIPGEYSVHNALAAGGAALMLGFPLAGVAQALGDVQGVPGRCEVLYNKSFTVITDFAHTADAIEKLLASLRPFVQGRMVVVFGCAGMRDAAKRPAMARAVLAYANSVVLTADNPRCEALDTIHKDVLPVLEAGGIPYVVVEDRQQAVHTGLAQLQAGDMLVLCGKGHEDYQVMNGVTLYCNEGQIVRDWIAQQGC